IGAFIVSMVTATTTIAGAEIALAPLLVGIGLLGVGIFELATHWSAVWRDIKIWTIEGAKFVVDTFLGMVGIVVDGAARAFGWVPGIGGKLKSAAKEFDDFRDRVNASLQGVLDKT